MWLQNSQAVVIDYSHVNPCFFLVRVCWCRRRWGRTVKRSKLKVCRSCVLFSESIGLLGRFRLFCGNSRSARYSAKLWVWGWHRCRRSKSGKREPRDAFCWWRSVDLHATQHQGGNKSLMRYWTWSLFSFSSVLLYSWSGALIRLGCVTFLPSFSVHVSDRLASENVVTSLVCN